MSCKEYPDLRRSDLRTICFDSHALETITFADGVTTIPEYTFRYMENLKTVHFSDTITEIGSCAFCAVQIPDGSRDSGQ
ncbi:MAG: leucine-rich repeat protein [Ruminococcus callidus]